MSKIKEEEQAANKYGFEMDTPEILKLTRENVALIEFLIRENSDYAKPAKKTAVPVGKKYKGSSAYWFSQLQKLYETGEGDFAAIIKECIEAVDRENSTHLNADNLGNSKMQDRLVDIGLEKLRERLKDRDFELVAELAKRTSNENRARRNPSFASKFCHYACKNLFEGENEEDNFSIYDSILCGVLPAYAKHYCDKEISKKQIKNDYESYSNIIDEIIEKSGNAISRNGFDHLLWYYHKTHPLSKNAKE